MATVTPYPKRESRPLPTKYGNGMTWQYRFDDHMHAWASWWHTMLGTLWGTDGYFRWPSVGACTDYGIGGALDGDYDGRIFMWLDAHARPDDTPWASGWDNNPDFNDQGKIFYQKFGSRGVNALGRAIEFSGQQLTPMTVKQWAAGIHLTAAIHHQELGQGYEEFAWNMQHYEVAEKGCPWDRIIGHTVEYQAGIVMIMKHYETGADIPDTIKIAGLNVPLAGGQDEQAPTPPPANPIFVPFPSKQAFTTRAGAVSRQWGYTGAKIVRRYDAGTTIRSMGYYNGEEVRGRKEWLVITSPGISNNARIHILDLKEDIPNFEGLAVK